MPDKPFTMAKLWFVSCTYEIFTDSGGVLNFSLPNMKNPVRDSS